MKNEGAKMSGAWILRIKKELDGLQGASQARQFTLIESAQEPWLYKDGRRLLNLSSNNYLGLAGDDRLKQAAIEATNKYGVGSTASRLVIGNHPVYELAESALNQWKKSSAALILNSGYTANLGIISSIIGREGVVFSDKLNHASIVDGIVLSRAEHKRYHHNDLNHLETLLKQTPVQKMKLIVTDAVFSMDGDMALLEELVKIKEKYQAVLMVDEAHSSGIYGPLGEGLVHQLHLQSAVDIQMGTFSKALGGFGAYVTGEKWLINYLTNKMRSLIFTTSLPPATLGAITAAITVVQEETWRRNQLLEHAAFVRSSLTQLGFELCGSVTQIIPILVGSNDKTLLFSQRLQEEGIAAIAIRPPTVPINQARIRLSLMATHCCDDLAWAVSIIAKVGRELGVIG
jgi:8-amino-7-oxononanoate synthase